MLKQLLGGAVDEREEKYGLNWHGKRRARQLALTPSTGTLRPCPEDSVDWDTTQNLMIEGDNLEVLKLLQKSYAGKVKLIYIDPPYNTGKDFVYPDNFQDNIKNYLELTGQVEGGGEDQQQHRGLRALSHRLAQHDVSAAEAGAESASRRRRDLYQHRRRRESTILRMVCDEVFGEENFVAHASSGRSGTKERSRQVHRSDHEYIVVYAQNSDVQRTHASWRDEAGARAGGLLTSRTERTSIVTRPSQSNMQASMAIHERPNLALRTT